MHVVQKSVPDPDIEVRGEGWGEVGGWGGGRSGRSSRPLDKRGSLVSKKIFSALRASVWSKNKGPGPSPGFATEKYPTNLTKLN